MGLWNVIKKIFSREKELCITVFGPSGAGKTSLLACMSEEFNKADLTGFLTADTNTFKTLKSAYEDLKKMGSGEQRTIRVEPLVPGNDNLREHIFMISGTKVKFFDFPGGWMIPDVSGEEKEHYDSVLDIVKKSMVVIIAIDTPYLMDNQGKYKEKAKVSEVEYFLQSSLNNLSDPKLVLPKLILLAPIKCEKYTRNLKDTAKLHETIKATYKQTVDMVTKNYRDWLALAMMPIHTIGNVEFSHFDNQHDDEMVFTRNKQPFAPRDADQPLRYAISFLLHQKKSYWGKYDMKRIARTIRRGIHDNKDRGFEIIHGRVKIF